MVRFAEIVNQTPTHEMHDRLIDHELTDVVYAIYHKVLWLSNRYTIMPYEFDGVSNMEIAELRDSIIFLQSVIRSKFKTKSSDVLKMLHELELYFDLTIS